MRHRVTAALAVGALLCLNDAPANAAEGGIGAYLWDRARTAPEWAVTKYLSKQFTIGLVGYYYQQLTPDTGTGRGPWIVRGTGGRARRRHWLHV
ncbi:hypothetical protein ABIB06_002995 [Bradyrhizobium sp. LB8.2]